MAGSRVALLGAGGAVGRCLIGPAEQLGLGPLRLGVRPPGGPGLPGHEVVPVDAGRPAEVARFVAGADLVINCLGPRLRTRARIAAAAAAAGAAYLDPAGDTALRSRVAAVWRPDLPALVGVGAVPGALGLLARGLLARAPAAGDLTAYVYNDEPIHPGTAFEFLLGLLDPATAAVWTGGEIRAGAPEPRTGLRFPGIGVTCDANYYLDAEIAAVAADHGLREARCAQLFRGGDPVPELLRSIGDGSAPGLRRLATRLTEVVNTARGDRPTLHLLAAETRGRSVLLRTSSSYRLTALMLALAAGEVLAGRVPPGVHTAAVLPPRLCARLPELDRSTSLQNRESRFEEWYDRGGAASGGVRPGRSGVPA